MEKKFPVVPDLFLKVQENPFMFPWCMILEPEKQFLWTDRSSFRKCFGKLVLGYGYDERYAKYWNSMELPDGSRSGHQERM